MSDRKWEPKFVSVNDFSEGKSCKTYPCMDRFVSFFSALFKIYTHVYKYKLLIVWQNWTNQRSEKTESNTRIKRVREHFKESDSVHWCLSLTKTVLLLIYLINLHLDNVCSQFAALVSCISRFKWEKWTVNGKKSLKQINEVRLLLGINVHCLQSI